MLEKCVMDETWLHRHPQINVFSNTEMQSHIGKRVFIVNKIIQYAIPVILESHCHDCFSYYSPFPGGYKSNSTIDKQYFTGGRVSLHADTIPLGIVLSVPLLLQKKPLLSSKERVLTQRELVKTISEFLF